MTKKYILENLGCAHCASKMEDRIKKLDGVEDAAISYPMKQLHLTASDPDSYLDEVQKICASIESEVKVVPKEQHSHHEHKHEHHDDCCCDHDHEHEHHDDCCSDHDHEHEHYDDCCSDHDHEHEHHHEESHSNTKRTKYTLENLGCAHCAAKMEEQINALDGVESATISYPMKQLILVADHPEHHLDEIQSICASIESAVKVVPKETSAPKASNETSKSSEKMDLIAGILLAIAAYAIGFFVKNENISLIAYIIAYFFLAKGIIKEAIHNIGKGQIFDENFLMCIATIGALLIGEYPEALGVILFYRIGEAFEDYAVEKSRASIMETVNMRPESVLQVHGDHTHEIPAEAATPGMIILVRPGDRIPLDGVVVEGTSQIDTSALTGEPVPVNAKEGDEILSGCLNQTGVIKLKVTNSLEESMVTRIMESMENAAASKPKIDRFITRFARVYTPFVIAVAALTAIIPSLVTGNWQHWIYTALTFLVISCPCALVLSVPLAFFSGIGLGSRQGILFKGGVSLEVLKDVKAVIMDKTGTITKGNFVLQSVTAFGTESEQELLAYAAACETGSTHPIAKSILSAAKEQEIVIPDASDIEEIAGHGIRATIDGKTILCGNEKLMAANHISLPDGKAAAGTEILLAIDGIFAGRLLISDTIKADSKSAIATLNKSVQTVMLTGDSQNSAKAIADETGIKEYYAKLLPNDKLELLQKLRKEHGSVMFVGDGINDAPVLAGADCGAAMGSGADAAIEAADVVFMTSELSAIPESIRIAKLTNRIAIQNIVFALTIKGLFLIMGLLGFASMWMAVFADTGVAVLCILNSIRILRK